MNTPYDSPEPSDAATVLDWMTDAACTEVDPEAFFPEKGGSTAAAKRICRGCDVSDQCLAYALATDRRFGIWGGKSDRERLALKNRQDRTKGEAS